MTTSLMNCPHCGGHDLDCLACSGVGALPEDFVEKVARGEGHLTSCEDCGRRAICVVMPGRLFDRMFCGPCYAETYHQRLHEQMVAERAERQRAALAG